MPLFENRLTEIFLADCDIFTTFCMSNVKNFVGSRSRNEWKLASVLVLSRRINRPQSTFICVT